MLIVDCFNQSWKDDWKQNVCTPCRAHGITGFDTTGYCFFPGCNFCLQYIFFFLNKNLAAVDRVKQGYVYRSFWNEKIFKWCFGFSKYPNKPAWNNARKHKVPLGSELGLAGLLVLVAASWDILLHIHDLCLAWLLVSWIGKSSVL